MKKSIFLNNNTEESGTLYGEQRIVPYLKKDKKKYYSNLVGKNVADNKYFGKTVKHLISDKLIYQERINLKVKSEVFVEVIEVNIKKQILNLDTQNSDMPVT